jgi:hypothetical protein
MKPGDLVTFEVREPRRDAAPVMYRTVGTVIEVHPGLGDNGEALVIVKPLRLYCYVYGHHTLGRFLPPRPVAVCALSELSQLFTFEELTQ